MQTDKIIPAVFNKIRQGSTMLSVMNYTNNYDEVADYNLVFHINYSNAIKRSLEIIKGYPTKSGLEYLAKKELISSYEETLSGSGNSRDTSSQAYEPIYDGEGKLISGVRWHSELQRIYLYGFIVHKLIHKEGLYPEYNKMQLTIAKDKLRAMTPASKFRQFIIIKDRFDTLGVEKLKLDHKDLLRKLI